MKLNLAIATAALSLLGAVSAQAQITFVVTPDPTATPTFGGDVVFKGVLKNNAPIGTVGPTIDGSSLTSSVTGFDIEADFIATDLPFPLNGGDSLSADMFELKTGGTTNYSYLYQLTSGSTVVAVATFNGTSAVPEPGSLALLASGWWAEACSWRADAANSDAGGEESRY